MNEVGTLLLPSLAEERCANASYPEAAQVSRIPDKMGGARRHPGIRNWSRTWLATAEVSQAHKSASRDECAYRETPFVSPRAVSNRCNTAERTRQQAGRQTVSARERWGVKVLRHQQTTAGGVKLQLITTRRLEAGSRLHHHPPLLVFRA